MLTVRRECQELSSCIIPWDKLRSLSGASLTVAELGWHICLRPARLVARAVCMRRPRPMLLLELLEQLLS